MANTSVTETAVLPRISPFVLKHYPRLLPSKVGSTDVFVLKSAIMQNSAILHNKPFIRNHFPEQREIKIADEDLPGGFRKENILSGQSQPLYDLAGGIVQIDGIKVLFNAKA